MLQAEVVALESCSAATELGQLPDQGPGQGAAQGGDSKLGDGPGTRRREGKESDLRILPALRWLLEVLVEAQVMSDLRGTAGMDRQVLQSINER